MSTVIALTVIQCKQEPESPFRNINAPTATYVGMQTCKNCHAEIYKSFMQTGMGQSWGLATRQKSAADFSTDKALVYDSVKDFYYKPFWRNDSLCILEYRMHQGDTVHQRIEKVRYIVGSGQHTNSHILEINGYLHQAPITFYTQKGKWDLAPGFENGMNTRFDRKIEMECITCHNGFPEHIAGSLHKYAQVPLGIDCERCHGPGSIHVAEKMDGNIVDTARETDYSIVNPRNLSIEQQNNLCQRCHLQGIAVLNNGKSFDDFLPSQTLSNTMHVFMPFYTGDETQMIMASHVERMKMSACYVQSQQLSCITCHNPHVSVKQTPVQQYLNACKSCHNPADCKEPAQSRTTQQDNCVACHMPKNGSIDIPHVAVTDHYIRRKISRHETRKIARFAGMVCYNHPDPEARIRARAFLEFYERYEADRAFLDSARFWLTKAKAWKQHSPDPDQVRLSFLLEDYPAIIERIKNTEPEQVKDAWTAYRIGDAWMHASQPGKAILFFQEAVRLKPLHAEFRYKLANAFSERKQNNEARKELQFIISEFPRFAPAYALLGYLAMEQQSWKDAAAAILQSLQLDPDQIQPLVNLSVVYYQLNQKQLIKPLLLRVLQLDPGHTQASAMLTDLESN